MSYIDIGIIAILLIAMIIGYAKGFIAQIGGFLSTVLAIILTILLYKKFAEFLTGTSIYDTIYNTIYNFIAGKGEVFTATLDPNDTEALTNALTNLGIPKILHSTFLDLAASANINVSIAEYIGTLLAGMIITDFGTIVLFFVLKIGLKIVFKIFKNVKDAPVIGKVDRILGMLWCFAFVLIIISGALLLISLSINTGKVNTISEFVISDIKLDSDAFSIGKFIYNNNPISIIFSKFNFKDLLSGLLSGTSK